MKRPPHDAQKDRTTVTGSEAPITLIKCASQRDDSCCPLLKPHLFSSAFIHACWRSVRAALEEFTATKPSPNGTPAHSPSLHLPIAVLPYAYNQYPPPSPHTHTQKSPRVKQNCPPACRSGLAFPRARSLKIICHWLSTMTSPHRGAEQLLSSRQPSPTKQNNRTARKWNPDTKQDNREAKWSRDRSENKTRGGGNKMPIVELSKSDKKRKLLRLAFFESVTVVWLSSYRPPSVNAVSAISHKKVSVCVCARVVRRLWSEWL